MPAWTCKSNLPYALIMPPVIYRSFLKLADEINHQDIHNEGQISVLNTIIDENKTATNNAHRLGREYFWVNQ